MEKDYCVYGCCTPVSRDVVTDLNTVVVKGLLVTLTLLLSTRETGEGWGHGSRMVGWMSASDTLELG